ncbi:MAG: tetratricopeptide repeat protein [Planctomycetota bacterium]
MNPRIVIISTCLMVPAVAASADEAAERGPLDQELHELVEQVSNSARELWYENIEAPPPLGNSRLSEKVGVINRLRLDSERASERRDHALDTSKTSQEPTSRPVRRERPTDSSRAPVAPEVLAKLQASAPKDPAKAAELADTLFSDGHYEPAYALYEAALKGETSEPRASWLVFQMANCKRESNPESARQLYLQLIEQYPESRWIPAAKAQEKIIQWQQVNEPQKVLQQARGSVGEDVE